MSDRDGIPIEFDAEPHGTAPSKTEGSDAGGPWLKIEEAIAALAMGLICLISLANVVVRYLTDISFAFTEEFSVFLLVVMTLVGASIAFARNEHIRITFFLERFPRPVRLIVELLILAITTMLFAMIMYYGATFALDQYEYGEVSAGLGYPSWIYSVWLPLLSLVILFRVVEHAWRLARARRNAGNGRDGGVK
ncbi:TRAP transporter small permease [Thalassospira mesophila]|uniref:TRAP transporter small permease n=1 Tax=Thalassospira mesophila TaxID=1293891 RepID=UPI001FE7AA56|nr:TRAP transporter small permease [Thalassospira mesophila]